MQEMAEAGTTAQVHPQKLTTAFMEAAQASGAKLVRGTVQGITVDKDSNSVTGDCITLSAAACADLPGLRLAVVVLLSEGVFWDCNHFLQ